jgi:hypothetical protein
MYKRNFTRMKPWEKIKSWVEKGLLKPPPLYAEFKMFDINSNYNFKLGKTEKESDTLYLKFFKKYPNADLAPIVSFETAENPKASYRTASERFIARQRKYIKDGYNEDKAFQMVEAEMAEDLQKEKFERSLFEGLATSNRSRSLMSYYEQEAEFEARQKLKHLQTTLPQFKRHQVDLEKIYQGLTKEEDMLQGREDIMMEKYEPATCIYGYNFRHNE